ncbi:hypothetical protein EJ05DRAFT_488375 [Pseudovirgaria hyperparasitica]|uniref:Uncharacterized protein n=1 Tax=Pseudovirgaria hyperparasitica TaxID=470096 RepID=A0A6A6VYD3_9PEZI|nr:uncharacterized protein EJ05DRAFT_488375 [Pseudovirgaria hyperparasitica]KAF2755642.1 hypothetical protein EJ05DRAFT_488375 [Pseudovirgaria hyperparasitica]
MSPTSSEDDYHEFGDRYAIDDMSDYGRWESSQQLQIRQASRSVTSPISSPRYLDHDYTSECPSSSPGNHAPLTYRPRRYDNFYEVPSPRERDQIDPVVGEPEWPPPGWEEDAVMSAREAQRFICDGANTFNGTLEDVPNAPYHYKFFATIDNECQSRSDRSEFAHASFKNISMTLAGSADTAPPTASLEQPCMAHCFGRFPGTTTLNYRVSSMGTLQPPLTFRSNTYPKKIRLLHILDRLRELEKGLEDEDPEELYKTLYDVLIEDPDRHTNPHYGMELQIADLINVLTNPDWINFSLSKNQVVAKFFDSRDANKRQKFFHQLLLSVELYLRIESKQHDMGPKRRVLRQLPPKVAWDMAVAQRWMENMVITREASSSHRSTFSYDYPSKTRQKEALRRFASLLKWPNMDEVDYILEEKDSKEKPLEDRSADAMSWFSGVILPGPTMPWILMNTLIDCDTVAGDALKVLTHMSPFSGFQYRASTYWSYQCIVGKVLGAARGVGHVAGWVGPCAYAPDLRRTECARVRQYSSPEPIMTPRDVETIAERTDALGPEYDQYPVADYDIATPDLEDVTDAIRIEKLVFNIVEDQSRSTKVSKHTPYTWDAALQFACGSESWKMRLKYNVDFVTAFPCHNGPHALFNDYKYHALKVDHGLVDIHDWADQARGSYQPDHQSPTNGPPFSSLQRDRSRSPTQEPAHRQINEVMAIEAFGVSDNEVFARSWCAQWGHSAIIANIKETCLACAIREAYAACISVVILTEGGRDHERDQGVHV